MLFRLPYKGCEDSDDGPVRSFDPQDPRFGGKHIPPASMKIMRIRDKDDKPLNIVGEYETSDRKEVRILMRVGGMLDFNPQDAIDEGIFSREEMAGLGFVLGEPVEAVEPEPLDAPEPRFEIMNKDQLLKWCLDQEPPINLDTRKHQNALVVEVKAELAKRANPEPEPMPEPKPAPKKKSKPKSKKKSKEK